MDILLFVDTGLEFPQMYEHIDKLEQYLQFPITRLKPPHSFEYLFYEYAPPRKNPALEGLSGLSWPGPQCRWCTARLKTRIIDRYLRELKKEFEVVQYIGIAADEQERVREFQYPLVEWEMAEADCLAYCRARGFDWGGLYDLFRRVSCWCCPLQPLSELRTLRKHFPELWEKLRYMDAHTWRQFRADYSVEQLEQRFALEDVPFPVSWTVKMKKKQKETQDILSYHTQAAGCSDKARAKASGGRQPIEECGRTGL